MKNPKANIGDYILEDGVYSQIIDITEHDGENFYHLVSGLMFGDDDFSEDDIRLESEVNLG